MGKKKEIFFEEALLDDWAGDLEVVEVPLDEKPLFYVGLAAALLGVIVAGRVLFLGVVKADLYSERAEVNLGKYERLIAPRGVIRDRFGEVLARNQPVFSASLDVVEFLHQPGLQAETLTAVKDVLGMPEADVWQLVRERDLELSVDPILLQDELSHSQLVALKSRNLPTLKVENSFRREYPAGSVFSSVVGYIGLTTSADLRRDPELGGRDFIGKSGLEAFYDRELRGAPGLRVRIRDAKGNVLEEQLKSSPQAGKDLALTLDAGLQEYFYRRMQDGLAALGRERGVGLAINPQNGEILALLSFPTFDNNVFSAGGDAAERLRVLNAASKPIFNRAISGLYSPGSTVKPLVGLAAFSEGVIASQRSIFSPGYLEVANPYNPDEPTRFLDWRYQGEVNLYSAIAQSSNVYFYLVGGGGSPAQISPAEIFEGQGGIDGLGIERLREWWQKFRLDVATGVDLPGEAEGFLPSPDWKEKRDGQPWLLGDTYNVAIGQGDLLVTPLQLLNYISALANGGKLYEPFLKKDAQPEVLADLAVFREGMEEVQKGMRATVTSSLGTAHALSDLGVAVAGKTGSAQIDMNRAENAFFVGYAPYDNPQIAMLVLVENARQGSLNAVPIARDVLDWYYWNRLSIRE